MFPHGPVSLWELEGAVQAVAKAAGKGLALAGIWSLALGKHMGDYHPPGPGLRIIRISVVRRFSAISTQSVRNLVCTVAVVVACVRVPHT
jgi:hypothetical protein